MSFRSGVGVSRERDARDAGRAAAGQALAALEGATPSLVLLFATAAYDHVALVRAVREATGNAPLSGCSGEGVIARGVGDESSCCVCVAALTGVVARTGLARGVGAGGEAAGRAVAAGAGADGRRPVALLAFPDGVTTRWETLAAGLKDGFGGAPPPLFGGYAGDNWRLERTWQYADAEAASDAVAWVALDAGVAPYCALAHSCVPVGAPLTVTRAEGHSLYELDGRPVLEFLRPYLTPEQQASWDQPLVNLALGLAPPPEVLLADPAYGLCIVHLAPTAPDARRGFIALPLAIPTGTVVQLVRRDQDFIARDLDRAAFDLRAALRGRRPGLVLQFDCCSRGKSVFREERKLELLRRLHGSVDEACPWLGFYCYNEVAPVAGQPRYHSYTAVLLALAEA